MVMPEYQISIQLEIAHCRRETLKQVVVQLEAALYEDRTEDFRELFQLIKAQIELLCYPELSIGKVLLRPNCRFSTRRIVELRLGAGSAFVCDVVRGQRIS